MPQPQWITPAGSLGTIPEGVFYQVPVRAEADGQSVFYQIIAGQLPAGVQVTPQGIIEGVPRNIVNVQGVPTEVSEDVTSKFAIRAYTTKVVNDIITVDRLADRTFTLTITGQDAPEFITPAGNIGTYYDASEAEIQIQFTDSDFGDNVKTTIIAGQLPPGLTLNSTGLISGIIRPLVDPSTDLAPGWAADSFVKNNFNVSTSQDPVYDTLVKDGEPTTVGWSPLYYLDTLTGQYVEISRTNPEFYPPEQAKNWVADRFTGGTGFDVGPFDFTTRASSKNFQFTVEISDGKQSNTRVFEIYVYSRDTMTADTTEITADNTFITADVSPVRVPVLINPEGSIGQVRSDNFFAYQFVAEDFDGDPIAYEFIPSAQGDIPGLDFSEQTGWLAGYIPDQGATETTYSFSIRVYKANNPGAISNPYNFTLTLTGAIETEILWLTNTDLGTIENGAVSTLGVRAVNTGGRALSYRLEPGSNSQLPQGLTLQPSGNITGRVSFNTFALDGGSTTFDINVRTRGEQQETTFDMTYSFTVNAYASALVRPDYRVADIIVTDGGFDYDPENPPTVTFSAPTPGPNAVQAVAGPVTIFNGEIVSIAISNAGRGYLAPPVITITGGGGSGAFAEATIEAISTVDIISVLRRFTVKVIRAFNEPYQGLYIKAMPPEEDRAIITDLVQDQSIIPQSVVYRADDTNFGVAKSVIYEHAFGLRPEDIELYVESLAINHYWKNLTLGQVEYAQARNAAGEVIYEAVYSKVIDDQVNSQGQSVSKAVTLPYTVDVNGESVSTVYPNSLVNMRDQVVDTVGQINPLLPAWMTSKQADGRILGFVPAWVIAYVKPGEGAKVVYNIRQQFGDQLNKIDFKADRYEIDRRMTFAWDNSASQWLPAPPNTTTFDAHADLEFSGQVPGTDVTGQVVQVNPFESAVGQEKFIYSNNPDSQAVYVTLNGQLANYYTDYTIQYGLAESTVNFNDTLGYVQSSVGDGSTTDFTLDPLRNINLNVIVGPNLLQPGVDYTVSGSNVAFTVPPAAGAQILFQWYSIVVVYQVRDMYLLDSNSPVTTPTTFDGGSTRFVSPAFTTTTSDEFDKYLLYPRTNILG